MNEEEIDYWLKLFSDNNHAFMSKDGKKITLFKVFDKLKKLQQENQQLKNDINKLQKELNEENLQCSKYSIEFNDLQEENKQLKDNSNKLKKFLVEKQKQGISVISADYVLYIMIKIERGESDE